MPPLDGTSARFVASDDRLPAFSAPVRGGAGLARAGLARATVAMSRDGGVKKFEKISVLIWRRRYVLAFRAIRGGPSVRSKAGV